MKKYSLLIWVIRFSAIFLVGMSICQVLINLVIDVVSSTTIHGQLHFAFGFVVPDMTRPSLVRNPLFIIRFCRDILISLSLLGGIQIGLLLLNNHEKLRGLKKRKDCCITRAADAEERLSESVRF